MRSRMGNGFGAVLVGLALLSMGCASDDAGGSGESNDTSDPPETDAGTSGDTSTSSNATDPSSPSTTGEETGVPPDTNDTAALDEVEMACELDCDAQFATECPPPNSNPLVCKLNCAVVTVQTGSFCLSEYIDWVRCRGEGGYDCLNEFPTQRAACTVEQLAYSECSQNIGCELFCQSQVEDGCATQSFDACVAGCEGSSAELPERCRFYDNSYFACLGQTQTACGLPDGMEESPCTRQVNDIAECIADETEDLCQGYCYAAGVLGCADGCMADCQSRLADATCGETFSSLIDFCFLIGEFECNGGRLVGIDSCESDQMQYDACVAGG